MIGRILSLAVATALLAGAVGNADAKNETKKLYRWVDKDGKVQFSDALPPEAVDQARTEFNSESGSTTARIDRALTTEERIAKEKLERELEIKAKEAEQARKTEEAMIASFQNEAELERSFKVRVELLQQTLEAIEAGIGSQRASLTRLLADASEAELAGKPIHVREAGTIRELHQEMVKQQQMLVLKQGELVDMDHELARLLERFRELKAPRERTGVAPTAPADAVATPTG